MTPRYCRRDIDTKPQRAGPPSTPMYRALPGAACPAGLAAVKRMYDPHSFFGLNRNIAAACTDLLFLDHRDRFDFHKEFPPEESRHLNRRADRRIPDIHV